MYPKEVSFNGQMSVVAVLLDLLKVAFNELKFYLV